MVVLVDGCPNCSRLERLLYASIASNAAQATSTGLQGLGVPPVAADALGGVAGEVAGKEAVKGKRKASSYAKRYGREYRRIKKKNTLKNGKMRKGYGGKRGHVRMVKEAHKAAKKGGRK